ncbi:hypothetical protein V8F06_011764 [Rhypophila decipiens]
MARTKRPPAKKKGKGKAAATGSSSHEIPTANDTTTGDTNEATSSGTTTNSAQAEPSQTPSHSKGPETRSSLGQKDRKDSKAAEAARSETKSISDQPKSRPAKPGIQAQHKDKDGEMWYEVVWEETWEREADINKKTMDEWKEKLKDKNFDPEASFSNPFPYKDKRRPAAAIGRGEPSHPTTPLDNSNEENMGGETRHDATNAEGAGQHDNGDAGVVDVDGADDGNAIHGGDEALGGLDPEMPRTPLKRTRSVVDTGPDDAGGPSTAKAAEKEPEHVNSDSNCEPSSSGSPKPKSRGRPPRKSTASTQEEDSVVNDAPRTSRGGKGATTKEKPKRGGKK